MIQAVFFTVLLLFDLPTSVFADTYDRRKILIVAALLKGIGGILFVPAWGLSGVLIAYAVIGLSNSFYSGVEAALFFDIVQEDGKWSYSQVQSAAYAVTLSLVLAASLLGGAIAQLASIQIAMVVNAIGAWFPLLIALAMRDPKPGQRAKKTSAVATLREAMRSLHANSKIALLARASMVLAAVPAILLYHSQIQLTAVGAPLLVFGALAAWRSIAGAAASTLLAIHRTISPPIVLVVALFAIGIGVTAYPSIPAQFAGAFITAVAGALSIAAISSQMNLTVVTERRATVNSLVSVGSRVIIAILSGATVITQARVPASTSILLLMPLAAGAYCLVAVLQQRLSTPVTATADVPSAPNAST
ncbi:MAG: hypothetical protein M3O31_06705 [Acidobacteriota bacterium]|nr:hypothetical protein [Acidobacteriota bacterium]